VLKTFENFYVAKDYPNALLTLKEHKSELEPGVWHYNMGTVSAQMQRLGEARYHLLMASKSGFNNKELNQNLSLVEQKLDIKRLEQPLDTKDYIIKGSLLAQQGFLTFLSFAILLMGLWILKKKADFRKIVLFLVLVLAPIALNFWISSWPKAVATAAQPVNDGPSVIFGTTGELPPGVLIVLKGEGEWREIIYPSRFKGWIKSTDLLELE
jgi:hypothetical protein